MGKWTRETKMNYHEGILREYADDVSSPEIIRLSKKFNQHDKESIYVQSL
jgi:hypothetical protein